MDAIGFAALNPSYECDLKRGLMGIAALNPSYDYDAACSMDSPQRYPTPSRPLDPSALLVPPTCAAAATPSGPHPSHPSVMIGAALRATKAVGKGLQSKPWVKTTLAPGSKVVSDYYERAELTPYLDKLGFNLVGYGCTTCIGN